MMSFQVSFNTVTALLNGESSFPLRTPKRWHLIAEYVQKMTEALNIDNAGETSAQSLGPMMILGHSKKVSAFQCTPENCKILYTIVSSSYKHLLSADLFKRQGSL